MCDIAGVQTLQRGMNFELMNGISVILMSLRSNAPYADRIEDNGQTLIYEGHDRPKTEDSPNPKLVDQPEYNDGGGLTQNGMFHHAAQAYKSQERPVGRVRVFQKIWSGVWSDNGLFELVDSWLEKADRRTVFKFKLTVCENSNVDHPYNVTELSHTRLIPLQIKLAVWRRDHGKCVKCDSTTNLHFDHIIPFSLGGSSLVAENIQILCARHNLEKRDKIE
jgi:hypothetical protein